MSPKKKNKPIDISNIETPRPLVSEPALNEAVSQAIGTLYDRVRSMDAYSGKLTDTDAEVKKMLEKINGEIHWTYRLMMWIHLASYLLGVIAVMTGFYLIVINKQPEFQAVSYICIIGGFIIVLYLITRNPIKNARYLVTNFAKLSFAYSSYMRQIYQVDNAFRLLLGTGDEIGTEKLETMFKMTQDAVDEVMNSISQMLNEIDD
jgi:Na+-transporting NADH:ubiquinone oxidoreductase subunit NqrB